MINNNLRYKNKKDKDGELHKSLDALLLCSFGGIIFKYDTLEDDLDECLQSPTDTYWYCIECAGSFYGTLSEVIQHWIENHMTEKWFNENIEVWSVLPNEEAFKSVNL